MGNSYYEQNVTLNDAIFTVCASLLDELYQAGARNFLFLNVLPVNLSPLSVEQGPSAQTLEAADISEFNSRLTKMTQNMTTYPDSTVFLFDANGLFNQVLQNPTSFTQTAGYRNTTGYCVAYENGTPAEDTFDPSCGVPVNEYFWLNTLRPTYPMHDVLGQEIAAQLEAETVAD